MSSGKAPLDAIMALDLSGSVAGEALGHLRRAGMAVLDALGPMEQTALMTFSESISLGVGLTKDRGRVREVLEAARGFGDTALIDASYAALVLGEADAGRALVIVFSDGLDTSSWLTASSVQRPRDVVRSRPERIPSTLSRELLAVGSSERPLAPAGGPHQESKRRHYQGL